MKVILCLLYKQNFNTQLTIEYEQEEDGRWIAEVLELPGVLIYGESRAAAITQTQALALRVLAERIEQDEIPFVH